MQARIADAVRAWAGVPAPSTHDPQLDEQHINQVRPEIESFVAVMHIAPAHAAGRLRVRRPLPGTTLAGPIIGSALASCVAALEIPTRWD